MEEEKQWDAGSRASTAGDEHTSLVRFVPAITTQAAAPSGRDDSARSNERNAALLRALQRLESVIDEEVVALQQRQPINLDQFSQRKNRGLLELVRSDRAAGDANRDPVIVAQIVRLRSKLEHNEKMLRLHFDAVRSVADIICRAIREAESDGTYPASAGRKEDL